MDCMAAVVCDECGWQARCFREKRARKRRAKGTVSLQRALRRESIVVVSEDMGGPDSVSRYEGAMITR